MRRILAAGLFWLALLSLLAAALSLARAATSTEGLADLGWIVFAILLVALAGGLMGGYLLLVPAGAPPWRVLAAGATAAVAVFVAAFLVVQGDGGGARVLAFLGATALAAGGGLARAVRLTQAL